MVSSSASVHSMALQCWQTGEYIGSNMMQDLETNILLWHSLVSAILGLPELSPGLGSGDIPDAENIWPISTSLATCMAI